MTHLTSSLTNLFIPPESTCFSPCSVVSALSCERPLQQAASSISFPIKLSSFDPPYHSPIFPDKVTGLSLACVPHPAPFLG